MAHSIGFAQANKILQRPPTMTPEQCSSVEVYLDSENCVTRWQLTDEELADLKGNGGKLYLRFFMPGMPPVIVGTKSPFEG